jgi:ribonuclease BN (tRNA processing enzyme)
MSKELEIVVLGGGSVLLPQRFWSSFVVNGDTLFDAPPCLTINLHQVGLNPLAIQTVFISHFHGDHFAGLPFLFLEFDSKLSRVHPLTIVGPPGIRSKIEGLYETYYPGFPSLEKGYIRQYIEVEDGLSFTTNSITVAAHAMNHSPDTIQAFGYRIERGTFTVAYTGDTAWCKEIFLLAEGADALIIDCTYIEGRHRANHLSFDDIREVRSRLPSSTLIILTHLGAELDKEQLPNVVAPLDYGTIVLRKS